MTTLSQRINDVMKEVKALEADKKHQQGYGYISADKILARVGEAMASNGLSIVPAAIEHNTTLHTYTDSYGKDKMLWQVDAQLEMSIMDIDGAEKTVKWTGSGVDYATPDKALYKAMTSGHKYFVMKLFMVGVGNEDGEHEAHEEIRGRNVTKNPPAASKKQTVTAAQQKPSPEQVKAFHALGTEAYGPDWNEKRPEIVEAVTGGRTNSSKHLSLAEWQKLMAGMEKKLA